MLSKRQHILKLEWLHLEVRSFLSLKKMVLIDISSLCFYRSVRSLGFLNLHSSAGADVANKCFLIKGELKLHSPFRHILRIRVKL